MYLQTFPGFIWSDDIEIVMLPRPPRLPGSGNIVVPRLKPSPMNRSLEASRQCPARMSRGVIRRASDVSHQIEDAVSKIVRKTRAGSHTPLTLPQPLNIYRIQVIIKSNWGDPEAVTCSEIDCLGKDRVPITSVVVTPENPIILAKMNNPGFLCNHS